MATDRRERLLAAIQTWRPLIAPALAMQALWLAIVAMTAAWWLVLTPSPLAVIPLHWQAPAGWNPVHGPVGTVPGATAWHLVLLVVTLVACAGPLAWALTRARRIASAPRAMLWLVLGATAVMGLTLVLLPVLPSDDLFSYIFYGRLAVIHHANPLLALPSQFASDPFYAHIYWRGTRSVYGPAWLLVSDTLTALAQALGGSAAVYTLLYRLLGLASHLTSTLLIWGILTRVAPRRRLAGTLLYAWNPLALWEFAASGHNDALMIAAFLAGVWLIARDREKAGLVAWGLSIAIKYVFVLVLPIWLWRAMLRVPARPGEVAWRLWSRRAGAAAWRGALALGAGAVLALPFWAGPATLHALVASPPAQSIDNSPMDMISWPIGWLVASVTHRADSHALVVAALKLAGLAALAAFLVALIARRAPRDQYDAWGWALFVYVTVASGWFWPWYVTWPLAIVALRPFDQLTIATLLLSVGALTLYGFLPVTASPLYGLRALVAFGPALGYLAWSWRRGSAMEPVAAVAGAGSSMPT